MRRMHRQQQQYELQSEFTCVKMIISPANRYTNTRVCVYDREKTQAAFFQDYNALA